MFGLSTPSISSRTLSCLLSDFGYALIGLEHENTIRFCEYQYFDEASPILIARSLARHVEQYHLYGHACQVVLAPTLYQLIQMDALDVAEREMAKALRWQLKGLIDYSLNDIAVDAFSVPLHGSGDKRKKVFVAATPQSALRSRLKLLEDSLLHVTGISVAELALSALLPKTTQDSESPILVLSFNEHTCQLHVYYKGDLYLLRALSLSQSIIQPNSYEKHDLLLEIQRSIDYCLMELKLPEPQQIIFTPNFYEAQDLLDFLKAELGKSVDLLDPNALFTSHPLAPDVMAKVYYAIGGALMPFNRWSV
jgi:MSHA biogenesis protein MshI